MRHVLLVGLFSSVVVACGSDAPPLGGPYGGTATTTVGPNEGSGGAASAGNGSGTGAAPSKNNNNTGASTGSGSGSSGGTSSSDPATMDAGSTPVEMEAGNESAAPTWSTIYSATLAAGTEGNCGTCHSEMSSASGAYSWLTSKKQLGGASPELVSSSRSCLSWLGGDMPPLGPTSDATATAELQAWAAAGAQDN